MTKTINAPRAKTSRRPLLGGLLTYVVLVFWSLVCLFPLYWLAVTSLKGEAAIMERAFYLPFVDFMPTLDAWQTVLAAENDHLVRRLFNSLLVAITSTGLTMVTGGMAVYGLTRFQSKGRRNRSGYWIAAATCLSGAFYAPAGMWQPALVITGAMLVLIATRLATRLPDRGQVIPNEQMLFALLAIRILPPVVVVLPLYLMAQRLGALDTHFALIAAYSAANLPVAVWLMMPVFGTAATEQEEAAQIEGASPFGIFFTIFVPMVAASLAAIGLVIFVLCWNEYLFAAVLTTDSASTLPGWVAGQMSIKEAQVGGEGDEWPQLSAAILFMAVPLLAFTVIVQRVLGRTASRVV